MVKQKSWKETGYEWLIGANTPYLTLPNIPYFSIVAAQHKTSQRRLRRLLMRVEARINDG